MIFMGCNPAEAHPVSLQHLLEGKEHGGKQKSLLSTQEQIPRSDR
jgi:hypothetical protein